MENLGKILFFDTAVWALICGVGARLILGIMEITSIVQAQRQHYERPLGFLQVLPVSMWFLVILFVCTIVLDSVGAIGGAYALRAVVVSYFAF